MLKGKKRLIVSITTLITVLAIAVGATYSLLTSYVGPLENTFTIGKVSIELTETTGSDYALIPGKAIAKNPTITVKGGSEDCWLYVTVEKTEYFDDYLSFELADGWAPVAGYNGVFSRRVTRANGDVSFNVIRDNTVTVSDELTEEKMSSIQTTPPSVTFKAYAIQQLGFMNDVEGWQELIKESD